MKRQGPRLRASVPPLALACVLALVSAGLAFGASPAPSTKPVNMTGHWASPLDMSGIDLVQAGTQVTGSSLSGLHLSGTASGRRVAFVFWRGDSYDAADGENRGAGTMDVAADGNSARVRWASEGGEGTYNGTFVLVRSRVAGPKTTPGAAPGESPPLGPERTPDGLTPEELADLIAQAVAAADLAAVSDDSAATVDALVEATAGAGPVPPGTPVKADAFGLVVSVDQAVDGTVTVTLQNEDGSTTVYEGLAADPGVGVGQTVAAGQQIGTTGATGVGEPISGPEIDDLTADELATGVEQATAEVDVASALEGCIAAAQDAAQQVTQP